MGFLSLSFFSCGKGSSSLKKKKSQATENISCLLSPATQNTVVIKPDEDIKFYRTTVNKVLSEIRKISNYDPDQFWTHLTPKTRELLNYELNMIILHTNKRMNEEALYRSTAFFFSRVRAGFSDDLVYKVKYSSDLIFAFKIRAASTRGTHRFSKGCGKIEKKDVIYFNVPQEVKRFSSVKQVYECRSTTVSVVLMEMKNSLFLGTHELSANRMLYELPISNLVKEERNRRLELNFESPEISFQFKVKRKRDEIVRDWEGKEARLEFRSPDIDISEKGACDGLIESIENKT